MAMAGVRLLSWSNRCNDFVGPERTESTCVFLCLTLVVLVVLNLVRVHNLDLISFQIMLSRCTVFRLY